MPVGSIAQAIKLVSAGPHTKTSFTYYFAPQMPSYAVGRTITGSTTPAGTPYVYAASDYFDVTAHSFAESAVGRAMTQMNGIANVSYNYLNNSSADINVFGNSASFTIGTVTPAGYVHPKGTSGQLEYDLVITQAGTGSPDLESVLLHELLHTAGLLDVRGQGIPPIYTGDEESQRYTAMAGHLNHPTQNRRATELQLYDIAALQSIYGRDDAYANTATVYNSFIETRGGYAGQNRFFSIWDGGGADKIDASTLNEPALIDLRPGHFSSIGQNSRVQITAGATPAVVQAGISNVSIAFGAYIEDAVGSGLDDLIIGNLLTNKLDGGAGADVIYAEGVDSIHDVGPGTYDRVTSVGASKTQAPPTAVQAFINNPASQADHLLGGGGDDHLRGGRGNDLIEGGADDDYIIGGGGDDVIWGGDKDATANDTGDTDTVDYSASTAPIIIRYNGSSSAPLLTVEDGSGGTDSLHWIEKIVATNQPDRFEFGGSIPQGYQLTIDMAGAVDTFVDMDGAGQGLEFNNGVVRHVDQSGGTITLENVHTMMRGSAYDDEITDEASGEKRIDGGGGDDVITVGGSRSLVKGGSGDDTLNGGDGSDILIGEEGANELFGGGASDILESKRELAYGEDRLDGGAGADKLLVTGHRDGVVLKGGAGDDVIEAGVYDPEGEYRGWAKVEFGVGDGHDLIAGHGWQGDAPSIDDAYSGRTYVGIDEIRFAGVSLEDATLVWDVTITDEHEDTPSLTKYYVGIGDLAIVLGSGDAILFRDFVAQFQTFINHNPIDGPTGYETFDLPRLVFDDGELSFDDGRPNIPLQRGSTAGYDGAEAAFAAGIAGTGGDETGTSGSDDLSGGFGDDAINAGGGDDSIRSSGGNDAIDGGAGQDTLELFGARSSFTFSREGGTITVTDKSGLEGRMVLTGMEAVTFVTDNETFAIDELVDFYGTRGDDALVEGNEQNNDLYGLAGNDLLRGLGGNDALDGGAGADAMQGGAGDDIYAVDDAADQAIELAGEGNDRIYASVDYALGAGSEVELLIAAGSAALDLTGNELAQIIHGNDGANDLYGLAGNDALYGFGGVDAIDGGAGADAMFGGLGDDIYGVDDAGDQAIELVGEGNDRVYASVSYTLGVGREIEMLFASNFAATTAIDLTGNELAQIIIGNAGANALGGGAGNDALQGLEGNDVLDGGLGDDILTGGAGADLLVFAAALGGGNVDQIVDFQSGADGIALYHATFAGLSIGSLPASAFVIGTAAQDADDRIVYDNATGALYFDADGNGSGAAVQFATLVGAPALSASDFQVI